MKDFAALMIVFDPRSKLELVEFLLSDNLGATKARDSLENIKLTLHNWFDELNKSREKKTENNTSGAQESQTINNKKKSPKEEERERFKKFLEEKKSTHPSSATAELDLYLQEPPIVIDSTDFDILTWWNHNAA
jgi:hypothetical protein